MLADAFRKIKLAAEFGAVLADEAAVVVSDGMMYASNRVLEACTQCDVDYAFVTTTKDMARNLRAFSEPRVTVGTKFVTFVSAGDRSRATLLEMREIPEPPTSVGDPVDRSLCDALSVALKFTGDEAARPWTMGVLVKGGDAFATNNVVMVKCAHEASVFEGETLPHHFAKLLVQRADDIVTAGKDEKGFFVHFKDGWARSPELTATMPERFFDAFDSMFSMPEDDITDEWLKAVRRALSMAEEYVTILGDKIVGSHGLSDYEAFEDCPADELVVDRKILEAVLDVATHLDFTAYPKPVSFLGPIARGVFAGRIKSE